MDRKIIAIFMMVLSGIIFYFFILPSFDLQQFLESLTNIRTPLFFLALFAILIGNIAGGIRWSLIMKEINAQHSQNFFNAIGIFCFGQVAGLIVPSRVGNYTKVPLIVKLDRITYEDGLSAVNAETILDLGYISGAGIISIIILSMYFANYTVFSSILIFLTLIISSIALIILYKIHHFQGIYENFVALSSDLHQNRLVHFLALFFKKFFDIIQSTRKIFSHRSTAVKLCCYTLITQFFGIVGLFFIIESVHISPSFIEIFAILTVTYIIGIASLIPGGIGASDLSLIALLGYEGIPLSVATNIAILWRVAMYLPVLLIVGVYFMRENLIKKDIL